MVDDAARGELGDSVWPGPPSESLGAQLRRLLASPPGGFFHALAAIPAIALMWAGSYPGIHLLAGVLGFWGIVLAGTAWIVRLIVFGFVRIRRAVRSRSAKLFFVAPIAATFVGALLWMDVPLRARWAMARSAFEKELPAALVDPNYLDRNSHRVGSYRIISVLRHHDAVIFYERNGAFLNDAGFAYLPRGPRPEYETGLFENPSWRHLGGDWYAWTASW